MTSRMMSQSKDGGKSKVDSEEGEGDSPESARWAGRSMPLRYGEGVRLQ